MTCAQNAVLPLHPPVGSKVKLAPVVGRRRAEDASEHFKLRAWGNIREAAIDEQHGLAGGMFPLPVVSNRQDADFDATPVSGRHGPERIVFRARQVFDRTHSFHFDSDAFWKCSSVAADISGIKEIPMEVMPTAAHRGRGQQQEQGGCGGGNGFAGEPPNQ